MDILLLYFQIYLPFFSCSVFKTYLFDLLFPFFFFYRSFFALYFICMLGKFKRRGGDCNFLVNNIELSLPIS